MSMPIPTDIEFHARSRILDVTFTDGTVYRMSAEYLRVHSPSAEVQGHGPGQEVLQTGKEMVNIESIKPVGNYAIYLQFDDGHDTGIFSWETLYRLGKYQKQNWQNYLKRLADMGYKRIRNN